jgi:hypothetical protein
MIEAVRERAEPPTYEWCLIVQGGDVTGRKPGASTPPRGTDQAKTDPSAASRDTDSTPS